MLKMLKRLIYPCAQWLEWKASDLVYWAGDLHLYELPSIDLNDIVVGTINRDPLSFWENAKNNALLDKLIKDDSNA